MRKVIIVLLGVSLLLIAAVTFARPYGMGDGRCSGPAVEQQKFLDETRELRRDIRAKRFELMELYRSGTDQPRIDQLTGEIEALRAKVQEKAGATAGQGACTGPGGNCVSNQERRCDGQGTCGNQMARGCGNMRGGCSN